MLVVVAEGAISVSLAQEGDDGGGILDVDGGCGGKPKWDVGVGVEEVINALGALEAAEWAPLSIYNPITIHKP